MLLIQNFRKTKAENANVKTCMKHFRTKMHMQRQSALGKQPLGRKLRCIQLTFLQTFPPLMIITIMCRLHYTSFIERL